VSTFQRILRYVGASAVASGLDLAALCLLAGVAGLRAGVATTLASLAGGAINFGLCRAWLGGKGRPALAEIARQALLYGGLVIVGGGLWCGVAVELLITRLALPLVLAKGCASLLVLVAWNYPLSALVVFPREDPHVA
jgi:putative flippase GtrA